MAFHCDTGCVKLTVEAGSALSNFSKTVLNTMHQKLEPLDNQ
jgi:hypothetical protein